MVLSAKFCRQCGNLLDPSEMTTRSLDAPLAEPPPFDHPTRPANQGITSPTYMPPAMMSPQPPAPIIGNAPPSNNNTVLLIILALGLCMLIALGVVAFVAFGRFSKHTAPPPPPPIPGTIQKAPPPPEGPGIIPHPPQPPPPPGSVRGTLSPTLIYPGAEVVTEIAGTDGGVTQLRTDDSFDKVVDWYVEKIKPKNHVNMPGSVILDGDGVGVLISSTGDGTSIQVMRKSKDDK